MLSDSFSKGVFFLLLVTLPFTVNAEGFGSSIKVSVSGFVNISPPCVINNNSPIDVNFHTVMEEDINGLKSSGKAFSLPVDCGNADKNDLNVTFSGEKSSFDTDYGVATSDKNVSIRFFHNDDLAFIGRPFPFGENMQFTASLLKKPNVRLEGGAFTASATVKIDYR